MRRPQLSLVGYMRVKPDLRMPARARDWVAGLAAQFADPEAVDTVRLLTSEVVTNALQHGGATGVVRVALLRSPRGVRVEVTDEGGGVPVCRAAEDDDEDGRGLFLLDALARSWGHDPAFDGRGTTVWFEIDAKASA